MHCVVTAGPTYETMDNVRRLTNFSTGKLGTELANFLVTRGHQVALLIGEQATHGGERQAQQVETFTTTENLREKLQALAEQGFGAVFHAAAVSDFKFGKIWLRSPAGELSEIKSGKISTRQGTLLAELLPTPKIITGLRGWSAGSLKWTTIARGYCAPPESNWPDVARTRAWRTGRLTAPALVW